MPIKHMVEIGRIAVIHFGANAGKTAAIVDVIDQNRALIDGPTSGVPRQAIQFKRLRLTQFRLRIPHGTSSAVVAKKWKENDISNKWTQTKQANRLHAFNLKQEMTDFDRFKLYKLKQRVNRAIDRKFRVLKAKSTKETKELKKKKILEKKSKKKTAKPKTAKK
ncbi:60S ribosomal protein L14-like [Oppia nitens]|uniref:60S ribosomal protein L14-like n=1 Tax=Oppia nitens TaxID=1686743 RepID=UPI0023DC86F1|nr:60S ribosomal protein L14-like [Oppia nitens]